MELRRPRTHGSRSGSRHLEEDEESEDFGIEDEPSQVSAPPYLCTNLLSRRNLTLADIKAEYVSPEDITALERNFSSVASRSQVVS